MRSASLTLLIVSAINLLNYVDRYVVAALVSDLAAPPPRGLGLSDVQSGWLASGFIIVYLASAPLFGVLADRHSRPRLIGGAVAAWALATAAGAFATAFSWLLLARSLIGIGEAAYGSAAPALLADAFPRVRRGQVFAIFYAAIPLGAALGFACGGLIAEHFGWRPALLAVAAPGLVFAAAATLLRDPPRGALDGEPRGAVSSASAYGDWRAYGTLFARPTYTWMVLGYAAYTSALGALAFWTPTFLERVHGMSVSAATVQFGASIAIAGVFGTLAGGWLADRLRPRRANADLWVCATSTLLACPLLAVAILARSPVLVLPAIAAAEVLLFASTGPINTAIVDDVPAAQRGRAVAASIVVIHLFGDVPSPPFVGWLSERNSLASAMAVVPIAVLLAGLAWAVAARLEGVRPLRDSGR